MNTFLTGNKIDLEIKNDDHKGFSKCKLPLKVLENGEMITITVSAYQRKESPLMIHNNGHDWSVSHIASSLLIRRYALLKDAKIAASVIDRYVPTDHINTPEEFKTDLITQIRTVVLSLRNNGIWDF